jgi:hypothetical protein
MRGRDATDVIPGGTHKSHIAEEARDLDPKSEHEAVLTCSSVTSKLSIVYLFFIRDPA